ncbi:MAG: hypothetical protein JNL23_10615 [Chitinophagaceae bacterium]|nr:hypothetical protein [Chitinophagaceae bacterium]
MKLSLLLIALIPFAVSAQDCVIKKETDQFTREPKLSTGFVQLKLSALSIEANKKEFDFFFVIDGANKCFDDNSTLLILFEGNKQRNNLRNTGSMNCEGLFHFTVKSGPETPVAVKRLTTQKVTQFTFVGSNKKEIIISLTPAQQEQLMSAVSCIAAEAKKLYQ